MLIHGDSGLGIARQATDVLHGKSKLEELTQDQLNNIRGDVKSYELANEDLAEGEIGLIDAVCKTGLANSKSNARRAIKDGSIYVNDQRVDDVNSRLSKNDIPDGKQIIVLRFGKKKYALLIWEGLV